MKMFFSQLKRSMIDKPDTKNVECMLKKTVPWDAAVYFIEIAEKP